METAVSLIIPIYNAGAYLAACLDSVAAQTLCARTQVLLIDDGSTDASPQICDEYVRRYPNFEVLHRGNAGVSAARNAGIERARGEYIAFADADDLLEPQMLELLYTAAKAANAQMSICGFRFGTADGEDVQVYPFPQGEAFARSEAVRYMLENESFNALWNKLFLRAPIAAHDLRMTVGRRLGEDREFILHFLAVCDTLCYVPQALYYYRYVESGAIRRPSQDYAAALTTQYASDAAQFASLGVVGPAFTQGSALCFCERIAATIDVICRAYTGASRRRTLRRFFADDALQEILRAILPAARPSLNRYTYGLLRCMRARAVLCARAWMRILQLRTQLYQRLHGGERT